MQVYAAYHRDQTVLENSSSGGIFFALATEIFNENGFVVCSEYDYQTKEFLYGVLENQAEIKRGSGSKYFQSQPGAIFNDVKKILESGKKKVLFVGCPCQVHGLKQYLEADGTSAERLYLCDLLCHGVPSKGLWDAYEYDRTRHNKKNTTKITFKDKRNGWGDPTSLIICENKEISSSQFVRWFYAGLSVRPSCYRCRYTGIERISDITIGDFWGIHAIDPGFYNKRGNSVILVNTCKGKALFESIKPYLEIRECDINDCVKYGLQPSLEKPIPYPKERVEFWKEMSNRGMHYIEWNYCRESAYQCVKRCLKKHIKAVMEGRKKRDGIK